jgi:hypothetical protein
MKPKILIVDGGDNGKRIDNIILLIREHITKDIMDLHCLKSNCAESVEKLPVEEYLCLFIHSGDNLRTNGEPVLNDKAENAKIPLFLFSGGFIGFSRHSDYVFELSYRLLLKLALKIIKGLLKQNSLAEITQLIAEASKEKDMNDFSEKMHALKHDFLNRIGRILPEVNYLLNAENKPQQKYYVTFDTETLINYLHSISADLDASTAEFKDFLKPVISAECANLNNMISGLSNNIKDISKPSVSRKKFIQKADNINKKVEEIKVLFETIISRVENENS